MARFTVALSFLLTISSLATAQQDVQFSQYMLNSTFFNAAFAGHDGTTHVSALHRSQWLGYSSSFDDDGGAPSSQLISFSTPFNLKSLPLGLGVNIINDRLGLVSNFQMQFSLAYHKQLRRGRLSIGLQPSIISQSIDFSKFRFNDATDPLNTNERVSQVSPDLGVGLVYSTKVYYLGIGANHLLAPSFNFGLSEAASQLENKLETTLNISGGYNYQLTYNLVLTPSALVKTDLGTYSFDLSAIATYDDKIWGGVSYRDGEAVILLMGYSFLEDNIMRVGYAFDYVIDSQSGKSPTSHEIFIRYNLPSISTGGRKIVRTPRFRF